MIYDQNSSVSGSNNFKHNYYKPIDKNEPLTRFLYTKKSERLKKIVEKIDISDSKYDFNDTIYVVKDRKYFQRIDLISYEVYGDPSLWWIIAKRNKIKNPYGDITLGMELKIPDLTKLKNILGY
jgi:hypothetical protein